jgi:phage shock protein C
MSRYYENDRPGPYRARDGIIFGVCKGLARYMGVSVFWMRVVVLLIFVFTGFMPIVLIYFIAALLMSPEPVVPFETEAEAEFYNSYASSRRMALHRLKRTFDRLDRRIRRIEDTVTKRDYNWERRLNQ